MLLLEISVKSFFYLTSNNKKKNNDFLFFLRACVNAGMEGGSCPRELSVTRIHEDN